MRLCIATTEYPAATPYSGGIGSQYGALAPALVAQGHEVTVVTGWPGEPARLEDEGVVVHRERLPRRTLPRVAALPVVLNRAIGRAGSFDAVVAAEFGAPGLAYALRPSAPLVTHLHTSLDQIAVTSGWDRARRALPQVALQRRLERMQARRSHAFIAPTLSILDWTTSSWGLTGIPAAVVPNGVDVERVRTLAAGERPGSLPAGGPLVVFSGRLEARKGVQVLAQAMRAVWDAVPEARLVLAGADDVWEHGPMSDELRRIAGPRSDRLHLLGSLPPEGLFPVLAAADVVALPSLWEAFGIAALEAMALGRALVVTSGHGYDDFIRPDVDALTVPPADAGALGRALVALLTDPGQRERLGASAAERARDYDVPRAASAFATRLASLL